MLRLPALLLLASVLLVTPAFAAKALFDDFHAEDAGNADWVIDDNFPIPDPPQSGINPGSPLTYWTGSISSFGVSMVKRGYTVHSNVSTITYQNAGNPYDLSNYDVFIVPEPNTLFSASEKTAILNFVHDGGGLVAISDHGLSDRNNDCYDSPMIWNDLDPGHLLGVHFAIGVVCGTTAEPNNNITQTSSNVAPSLSDSITHGPVGVVGSLAFHNGSTLTLYPGTNPTIRGEVWMTGLPQTSTTGVMAASAQYGTGRVFFICDSSPVDDGSARPGNSSIFDGWGEATDSTLFMNAALWASRRTATGDTQAPTVNLTSPDGGETWTAGSLHAITWNASDNVGVTGVDLSYSLNGGATYASVASGLANSGSYNWTVPNAPGSFTRVRAIAHDAAGNLGSDSSSANFTIAVDAFTVAVSVVGGGSVSRAPDLASYPSGTALQLDALPGTGWAFTGWSGDTATAADPLSLVVTHALSFTATFADIAPPAVTVLAPNGGESWPFGSAQSITWSASDNGSVSAVDLAYSTTGSAGPWTPIASGLANSGAYAWTVPADASTQAIVRVTASDAASNASSDTSDAVFTILDPSAGVDDGPHVLALARPAPNPSSGEMLLGFSLPSPGRARIEVIDASGRRLAGTSGEFAAGRSTWRWDGRLADGSRAHAGLYFVRLVTPFGTRLERLVRLD